MLNQNLEIRNIELKIAYLGSPFFGWQVQPNRKTVQGDLLKRLKIILKEPDLKVVGSSRTDTGVHAHDQRASFWTRNPIPLDGLRNALNRCLDPAVRVIEAYERPVQHSVRYHAKAKHYGYFFYNRYMASPFISPFVLEVSAKLDIEVMNRAAQSFIGTRCFKAFQSHRDVRPFTETTIYEARVGKADDLVYFDVVGRNFLYHMVRNMAGSLLKVGRGDWSVDGFCQRLDSGERIRMGMTAPAKGLHLFHVYFGNEPLAISVRGERFRLQLQQTPRLY